MAVGHAMQIEVPLELYERIQQIAQLAHTTEENALLEGMPWLYTVLPPDIDTSLKKLQNLSLVQLWAVVYQRLTAQDKQRLHTLSERNKLEKLAASEQEELSNLLQLVDYQMLLRSEALVILKAHGQDIESYRHNPLP
jgi:hypothetical protein